MLIPILVSNSLKWVVVVLVIITVATPLDGLITRKLEDDSAIKCGSCQVPPSPPPPPPALPPPSPPPPAPKKPPSQNCPPPPQLPLSPPSSIIYITGPPGDLYPIDPNYSGAGQSSAVGLPVVLGVGLVGLLAFW